MNFKFFASLLFSFLLQKTVAQNAVNEQCNVSWEIQMDSITVYDLSIFDAQNRHIFDWSNMIGAVKLIPFQKNEIQLDCYQMFCSFGKSDSAVYQPRLVATIIIDTSVCKIKEKLFRSEHLATKPASVLSAEYKRNKKCYKQNKQISNKCSNLDYIFIYMYDLSIAALNGDSTCEKLLFSLEEDFETLFSGSGLAGYWGVIRLLYNLKYKENHHKIQKYHLKSLEMERLLAKDDYFK